MKHITTLLFVLLSFNLAFAQDTHMNEKGEKVLLTDEGPDTTIFTKAEVMPKYPGGDQELFKWVATQVQYPREAVDKHIKGISYVNFVVGVDGTIESAEIIRSSHPLLDEEALRVIRSIKGFTPGYQRGKPIRVMFTYPVRFDM